MPRPRSLIAIGCAGLLFACSTASIYRSTDVVVVADDPGADILPLTVGEPRPAVFEPFRARATWESLDRCGVLGERVFRLEAVGGGGATRGRLHLRLYPGRTQDGRGEVVRSQLVRCESDDSGAWYFDGVQARARLPRPGQSWLVWQLGWRSRFELDGRLLEDERSRWEGGVLALREPGGRTVRTDHWEVRFAADPGFCVQFAEEPGPGGCEVSAAGAVRSVFLDDRQLEPGMRAEARAGQTFAVVAADGSLVRAELLRQLGPGALLRLRVSRGGPAPVVGRR